MKTTARPYPTPRFTLTAPHYGLRRTEAGAYEWAKIIPETYFEKVSRWLVRMALRSILDMQRTAEENGVSWDVPTEEELIEWMRGLVYSKALIGHKATLKDEAAVDRLIEGEKGAAHYALSKFDRHFLAKARAGGAKANHHRRFFPEMLAKLEDLSKREQAARLNASTATVAVLRRAWLRIKDLRAAALKAKDRLTYTTGQGFDVLMDEIEADFWAIANGEQPPPRVLARGKLGVFA